MGCARGPVADFLRALPVRTIPHVESREYGGTLLPDCGAGDVGPSFSRPQTGAAHAIGRRGCFCQPDEVIQHCLIAGDPCHHFCLGSHPLERPEMVRDWERIQNIPCMAGDPDTGLRHFMAGHVGCSGQNALRGLWECVQLCFSRCTPFRHTRIAALPFQP